MRQEQQRQGYSEDREKLGKAYEKTGITADDDDDDDDDDDGDGGGGGHSAV